MKKVLFLMVIVMISFSCKKKVIPASEFDVGQDYYPQTIGKYVIYDADSTIYDEFTFVPTNYKYQIKEKIVEQFTDAQGNPALKLVRYIKKFNPLVPYSQIPWSIKDAWQVNVTSTSVQVVEENVRFTKLAFPVKKGNTWNGNANNTIGQWDYTYNYIDNTETINSVNLEKVLLVKQKDFRTLISDQYYVEKYARGVGLVYREITDIKFGVTPLTTPITSISYKTGTIYKLTLISYGYE